MDQKVIADLNLSATSLKTGIKEQLAIGQKAGESYNQDTHVFLETMLGMHASSTTMELQEKKKVIEITSQKMVVMKEFEDIQKIFGERTILDYAGLLKICNDHNLYFGSTSLFCGEMTPEAIEEAKKFDFVKARSILRTASKSAGEPVIAWEYNSYKYDMVIIAPITMFKLDNPNKIIIANREIIEHPKGQSPWIRKKCSNQDPVLLLPFRASDRKIYFILITNW